VLFVGLVGYTLLGMPSLQGASGSSAAQKGLFPVEGYLSTIPPGLPGSAATGSLTTGVLVPGVTVWLRNATTGRNSRATKTDLSGRFSFARTQPVGRYSVCWKAYGFVSGCSKSFAVSADTFVGTVPIRVSIGPNVKTIWGSVTLQDGSSVHTSDPLFNINSVARVWLPKSRITPRVYVNTLGQYILPRVPRTSKITVQARVEAVGRMLTVSPPSTASRRLNFVLRNTPPSIDGVISTGPGGLHWTAVPGDLLSLTAKSTDRDGDALKYRWLLPDRSSILNSVGGQTVPYTLPNHPGSYEFKVAAYDGKGGYAFDTVTVQTQGVRFAGTVKATDAPVVAGADVDVNGTTAHTDATGAFSVYVKERAQYVLNIRKAGYGLVSKIYDNAIVGGVWTLTRASVLTVDPTQPIDVANERRPTDCPGSLGDQARRQGKPTDGCGPGIRVQIPANSLVDGAGNPPTGPVQVALTTVDLAAPDGMPGDYSARDSSGSPFVMESAGAGTVEITGAGGRYNLAPGASAQITIPVNPAQLGGTPPPTIPLLSYDEQQGLWVQEGTATLAGGSYVGKVSHFSEINTDQLKVNQACVRIDATSMPPSFQLELRIPTSSGGTVTKTATIVNSPQRFHVAYNLPTSANVELRAFDTSGPTPTIINLIQLPPANPPVSVDHLTVNTGGPQNPTTPNLPVFPYSACQVTVELVPFALPPNAQQLFLNRAPGFNFNAAPDLNFLSAADAGAADTASTNYYKTIDPLNRRTTLAAFKSVNGFGSGTEEHALYANSGDLGFGRDMHCHRNGSDIACYVTNYGNRFTDDVQDFKDAVDDNGAIATVGMEYSQVENPTGGGFQTKLGGAVLRIVKFYVFAHNLGDARVNAADLDGFGARPVPGLCMTCHGGLLPASVSQPTPGAPTWNIANANTADLGSRFIPFDLREYTFAPTTYHGVDKTGEQPNFKALNQTYVLGTNPSTAAADLVNNCWYATSADQKESVVISGWRTSGHTNCTPDGSSQEKTYADVVGISCRSCHLSQSPSNKDWTNASIFGNLAFSIGSIVCTVHAMPHAKVTHNLFWLGIAPHQPPILKNYLNTAQPGSANAC